MRLRGDTDLTRLRVRMVPSFLRLIAERAQTVGWSRAEFIRRACSWYMDQPLDPVEKIGRSFELRMEPREAELIRHRAILEKRTVSDVMREACKRFMETL